MELTYKELGDLIDREFAMLELFDNAPFFVVLTDDKGHFIKVNKQWVLETGYTERDMTDKPFIYYVHPDDVQRTLDAYYNSEHFDNNPPNVNGFINRYKRKDGSYVILEWHSTGKSIDGYNLSIAILKGYE